MKKYTLFVLKSLAISGFLLGLIFSTGQFLYAAPLNAQCPSGSLYDTETGVCAVVKDRTQELLNKGVRVQAPDSRQLLRSESFFNPGGIGAGAIYNVGAFAVNTSTNLDTEMIVHPDGLGIPSNWIYTTATNRTEKGVEVVGLYFEDTSADLGIFDWSCSVDDPCPNDDGSQSTSPSWRWITPLNQFPCNYMLRGNGPGNHIANVMRYSNRTTMIASGTPPTWSNEVYLWNYCNVAWDLVYSHTYAVEQKACSADNSCGWWGPVIETFFPAPQPAIKELGFHRSNLVIDGGTRQVLNAQNSSWVTPPSEWKTYHLTPNNSWGVGSSAVNLTVSATDSVDPVNVFQRINYTITAHNQGPLSAANVALNAILPPGFQVKNWTTPQGTCTKTSCSLGIMAPGQSIVTTIVGRYTSPGTKNLQAVIDQGNIITEDNETDNIASEFTEVLPTPSVTAPSASVQE